MTGPRARAALFVGGILAAAALPLLGRAWRAGGPPRCALEGVRIDPARQVRVTDAAGRERAFCCVDCARRWRRESGTEPREVLVTDEATGAPIPAARAFLVESRIVAFAPCGCRVHVFARAEDARAHAASFGGIPSAWGER